MIIQKRILINFSLIVLTMFASCGEDVNDLEDHKMSMEKCDDLNIKIIPNPKYSLSLVDVSSLSEFGFTIQLQIDNNSSDTMYYLSNSCNGLGSFIEFNLPFYFCPEITCDYSIPLIHKILPNDSREFSIEVCFTQNKKSFEESDFSLNLVCVDRYVDEKKIRSWSQKYNTTLVERLTAGSVP